MQYAVRVRRLTPPLVAGNHTEAGSIGDTFVAISACVEKMCALNTRES